MWYVSYAYHSPYVKLLLRCNYHRVLRARRSGRHRTGFLAISMSVRLVIDLSWRFDWCYDLHGGYMWIICMERIQFDAAEDPNLVL